VIDYDTELQLLNERLREAYDLNAGDRVLDIGCGTGQTTREAARLAPDGVAVGVDVDEAMVARARELAAAEGIPNVRFEVADVERHPFRAGEFDVAISRFGTMFFADPREAFCNIVRAIRPGGHLLMMVWQSHDLNEWAVSIDEALGTSAYGLTADPATDPFSLGEPATIRRLLAAAGFESVTVADVYVPVYYGRDVDAALEFVTQFSAVSQTLQQSGAMASSIVARLRSTLASHSSERGVWFDSRAWIVRASA
jgi:ubiquinone/menaquinone biosynthesis C-methylase UbiE